jgi:hypothetical protein
MSKASVLWPVKALVSHGSRAAAGDRRHTLGCTSGVVNGDIADGEVSSAVDGHALDWSVLEGQASDGGLLQGVRVEELWLGLATVGTLSVPPLGTVTVKDGAGSTSDGDVGTRDGDKRTRPLLVTEGGLTLKDDLGTLGQTSKVKSGTGWDGHAADGNGAARGLALDSSRGTGESTGGTLADHSWSGGWGGSDHGCGGQEAKKRSLNHF